MAVAYSGGRDSTALLHATLMAAESSGITIHALHVHHGLSDHADAWLSHCEAQCQGWARRGLPVMFAAERLQLKPTRGESVEAVARTARYAALRRMALACNASVVLLAHHRRDQAETLLLQALRGAGAAGLAAMPASIQREGLVWARPWLMQPSRAIAAYVARHRLKHIEDDTNADPRFGRNRLRLQVWPALEAAFPQAEASLADAATHAQQAVACAADLAAIDLEACAGLRGLDLVVWRRLAPHRAVNALRAWLRAECGATASAAATDRLMAELQLDGPARWPFGSGGELRRYRGRLTWHDGAEAEPLASLALQSAVAIRRAGRYPLAGWGGVLVVERVKQGGVALRRLGAAALIERRGGELYQAAPGRTARSLKKQYQAAGVPAWARSGPLIFEADQLLFVPGLGIDARAWAAAGEPQVSIVWEPHVAG